MTPKEADNLVLKQAILRHKEKEARTKREWAVPHGYGWVVKGSVFDCNRERFTRALEAYSDRLYVGWNPMKNEGRGCWEVWHRPTYKTVELSYYDEATGLKIYTANYKPNDFEHWVADLPYLTMDFFKKLREMDAWENKHLIAQHDEKYEQAKLKAEEKEDETIRDIVKDNKSAFKDLMEYTQAGFDPLQFFNKKGLR